MTSPGESGAVILIDLRETTVEAGELRVFELLRNFRWLSDSGRVIVIDDAVSLVDHHTVYQAIQSSGMVKLLCLAVGPPASRSAGVVLRATKILDNQTVATLWVGHDTGVGWPTRPEGANRYFADQRSEDSRLRSLLDVLRVRDVFDKVIDLADDFPNRVASPGQLLVAGQVGVAELAIAQQAAVEAMAGSADRERRTDVAVQADVDLVFGTADRAEAVRGRVREGSPLHQLHRESAHLYQQAELAVDAQVGPLGPRLSDRSPRVTGALAGAASALRRFRDAATDLFTRIDGRTGLDQARCDDLEQAGIRLDEIPDTDRVSISGRLRAQVEAGLVHGYSYTALADAMRLQAERAEPTGSAARVRELDEACPETVLNRLAGPPPFPWSDHPPWVLAVVAIAAAIAGIGPLGLVTGPLLVAAWVGLTCLAAVRKPRPVTARPAEVTHEVQRAALWQLVAAGIGCAAGVAARDLAGIPMVVGLVLAGGAAAVLAVVSRVWWERAVGQWRASLELAAARSAPGVLHQVVCQVAVDEWVLNGARRLIAEGAFSVGAALDEVAATLVESTPHGLPGQRPAVSVDLRNVVTADLVTLTTRALEPAWDRLSLGAVDDLRAGLRGTLHHLLEDYARKLEADGLDDAVGPDTTIERAERVRALWRESPAMAQLMYEVDTGTQMTQLCTPEDLPLLDLGSERFRLIRFAPRAAQSTLRPGGRDSRPRATDVVWTSAGHIAGVLRLVPLRDGAVELSWPASIGEQDQL